MIYVFLADGFEEVEAIATVDMLRRARLEVKTVGVTGKTVVGAHEVPVIADILLPDAVFCSELEAVVLPGGGGGTENLGKSDGVKALVKEAYDKKKLVCAICAAPSVLGKMGLLTGKRATCFPGFEKELIGASVVSDTVCEDGNIITAKGCGVSAQFGLKIVERLCGRETADRIWESIQHD